MCRQGMSNIVLCVCVHAGAWLGVCERVGVHYAKTNLVCTCIKSQLELDKEVNRIKTPLWRGSTCSIYTRLLIERIWKQEDSTLPSSEQ